VPALNYAPMLFDANELIGTRHNHALFSQVAEPVTPQPEIDTILRNIEADLIAGRVIEAARRLDEAVLEGRQGTHSDWWHVRAVIAYHRNSLEEAVGHWRKAIRQDPRPHYRHNLASALCDLAALSVEHGRLPLAFEALCEAVQAAPTLVEAQAALGIVATEMQDWDLAAQALHEAIRLDEDHARAHDALGTLAGRQHRWSEAVSHHADAVRRDARCAEAWNNLGHALLQIGSSDKAVQALEQAVAISLGFAEAHNNLGNAYRDCGRFTDALGCYRQALELKPDLTEAQFNLADLHRYETDDAELTRLLQTPVPAEAPRAALLLFARGKAFDELGRTDEAFASWREANGLIRRGNGYDEARTLERLEQLRSSIEGGAPPSPADQPPLPSPPNHVFIVGAPRCGSTLLEQILASHPAVQSLGERDFFEQSIMAASPQALGNPRSWLARDNEQVRAIAEGYRSRVLASTAATTRSLIVDKFLGNSLVLGEIRRALPAAKIIVLFRDNRDLGLSCYSKRFTTGHPYAYDLAELGRYLSTHDRLLEAASRCFPETTVMRIQYEEMVERPEQVIRRLLNFLGLSWHPACLEFHTTSRIVTTASAQQVRSPINRHGVGRWRRYERHLGPLLDAL